jgi:glycogen synthase
MKLLMTVDAVGGVWSYAMELSRALGRHDVEIVLACMGPPPSASQLEGARTLANVALSCGDYRLEWMAQAWSDVARAGDWLLDLADREHVDLVHLNGYVHAALPWHRPVVVVAHSCVYSWWRGVHGCEPPPEWQEYRERVAAGLHSAKCVVAPTQAFLECIREIYRPAARMLVIHNARSAQGFIDPPDAQRLPVVLASGRAWDRAKGIDVLDAAADGLRWHTYVAGAAAAPDRAGVQLSSIRRLGSLPAEELAAWLQRAAIFAHPARYEPFGLAVLEAALGGCALVLADLPTLRELWDEAALFVQVDDAAALRCALDELIDDPERMRRLAHAASTRAQRYQPHSMGEQYLTLYRELLNASRSRVREVA